MDMDFGKENGTRNHKLDRVAALAQIARDLAESLDERIDANFHIIMKGIEATSERGVRQRERCSHLKRNKQIRQARHGSPWRTFPCRTHV